MLFSLNFNFMFNTIKKDLLKVSFLPLKTQILIAMIFLALMIFGVTGIIKSYQNHQLEKKIDVLQNEINLQKQRADESLKVANQFNAQNETLKNQLTEVAEKAKKLDDEITKQNSIVSENRASLRVVRNGKPVIISSNELRAKLCELYPDDCKQQ